MKQFRVARIPSRSNPSDILTKVVDTSTYLRQRRLLGMKKF
jgi:hypothetical protein